MDISKGLYQAPQGLDDLSDPIEIEIENPDSVSISMGDLEIDIEPSSDSSEDFNDNIADYMDESELESLGSELIADFEKDLRDRKEWVQTYIEGLKLLGLKYEERTEPWNGACGVFCVTLCSPRVW